MQTKEDLHIQEAIENLNPGKTLANLMNNYEESIRPYIDKKISNPNTAIIDARKWILASEYFYNMIGDRRLSYEQNKILNPHVVSHCIGIARDLDALMREGIDKFNWVDELDRDVAELEFMLNKYPEYKQYRKSIKN